MKINVPSRRYDIFIAAFEKAVTSKQAELKAMEAHQLEYACCQEVLEALNLPNEITLSLFSWCVGVRIAAVPSDDFSALKKLPTAICGRLYERGLRASGEPPGFHASSDRYPVATWNIYTKRGNGTGGMVSIDLSIPMDGIHGARVVTEERTTTETVYIVHEDAGSAPERNIYHSDEIQF